MKRRKISVSLVPKRTVISNRTVVCDSHDDEHSVLDALEIPEAEFHSDDLSPSVIMPPSCPPVCPKTFPTSPSPLQLPRSALSANECSPTLSPSRSRSRSRSRSSSALHIKRKQHRVRLAMLLIIAKGYEQRFFPRLASQLNIIRFDYKQHIDNIVDRVFPRLQVSFCEPIIHLLSTPTIVDHILCWLDKQTRHSRVAITSIDGLQAVELALQDNGAECVKEWSQASHLPFEMEWSKKPQKFDGGLRFARNLSFQQNPKRASVILLHESNPQAIIDVLQNRMSYAVYDMNFGFERLAQTLLCFEDHADREMMIQHLAKQLKTTMCQHFTNVKCQDLELVCFQNWFGRQKNACVILNVDPDKHSDFIQIVQSRYNVKFCYPAHNANRRARDPYNDIVYPNIDYLVDYLYAFASQ